MKDYKIIIKSADVAERLIGKYEELIGAIDCLNFDWCNEPFEVMVSMPTEENRGCNAEIRSSFLRCACKALTVKNMFLCGI